MSSTPTVSELRAALYFGTTGTNRIYAYEPSATSLVVKDYNGTKNTTYMTVDTINNSLKVPSDVVFDATNVNITNLTVTNFTGINKVGVTGPTGSGSVGVQGFQGFQGFQALQGRQGLRGTQGAQGAQGAQGLEGLQGFRGTQGAQGISNNNFVINNFGNTRVLLSDNTSTGANASTNLTFNSGNASNVSLLSISGSVSVAELYIQSVKNLGSNVISVDRNVSQNFGEYGYNAVGSYATRISSIFADVGNGIAVDTSGNSYVTGQYSQPATVYNSDRTTFATLSGGSGSFECFIVKYGPTGMGSWATKISGTSSDIGFGIAVDTSENSYLTGHYVQPSTVYNSDGTAFATLSGSGSNDVFIVKYGPTGMGSWTTRISGTSADFGQGIAVDTNGNSYVTGYFRQPAIVYNSDGTSFATLSGSGVEEVFVVKYGPTGMGDYVTRISGTSSDIGRGIAVDASGNSYVTGQYNQPATVYNSDGTAFTTLSGSGFTDCFIVKYGTTGMGSFATKISTINQDIGYGIAVDASGNSYVTGNYLQPATVYNSDNTVFVSLTGNGNSECFVVKYGITGMGSWATRISGVNVDIGRAIAVDASGNSYVTGQFNISTVVYNSDGTAFITLSASGGGADCFVVKYGTTGMGSWVTRISGTSSDIGLGIGIDDSGNSYVTGQYTQPSTVYNSDGTAFSTLSGSGSTDCFVVKYTSQYILTDLTNSSANNGKTVTLNNTNTAQPLTVLLNTTGGTTYGTYTITNYITCVFYNGTWYVMAKN